MVNQIKLMIRTSKAREPEEKVLSVGVFLQFRDTKPSTKYPLNY